MIKYSSKDILRLHKKSVDKAIRDIYNIRPTGDPNKDFEGSIYLLTLQAGYNYSKEYIINKVNKWLRSINL